MNKVKRATIIALSVLLLTSLSLPCSASDNAFKDVFENALYGGMAGALVGGACLVFTHKPQDHFNYVSVGAATGVIAGVGYSLAKQSRAFIAIEDGNVKFAVPTIMPEYQLASSKGASVLMLRAELVKGSF